MNYFLQHQIVQFLATVACWLPIELSTWIAKRVGDGMYFILSSRRRIALENINRAFGESHSKFEKQKIAQASFQHVAVSALELFLIPKMKLEAQFRFQFSGTDYIEEALAQGKGVVVVISHLGSWEYLAFRPFLVKQKWSVVVKPLKNPGIDEEIEALRQMTTVTPIPKKSSVRQVLKELRRNHCVAILIDQWGGRDGLWQDFFGEPTSTTSIPARFAIQTGCALVPAYCLRTAVGRYEIQIQPPCHPNFQSQTVEEDVTTELNRRLEAQILKYPEQWLWAHRRWKPKPEGIRIP